MWFWIRHTSAAIILVFIGAYVILNENALFTADTLDNALESDTAKTTKSSATKAMQGFGDFYADLKQKYESMSDAERELYVIELKKPNSSLTDELHKIGVTTRSVSGNWVGAMKNRRFAHGDTLRERMRDIAEAENMHLIWWLERDFVVKLPFRVEETTVGTLYKMSTAIDSDFERDVYAFFCPKQRTLVITDVVEHYIRENCAPARSADSRRWRLFR
ncbi:TcpQ domain-containing protein [Catenovulum sediminis]|uniref:TcpQ domain-containing protein n=1 Tax=Catenovulum sediminis TaxID=1740262 RepID=UPI00117DC92E|nr:TcpQ domain-containing protein [Catenovulum sediminis]